jgi:hypothetical protein
MLCLIDENIDLPMLGRAADDWAPCDGKLKYGPLAGLVLFTELGRKQARKYDRTLAGPISDCRDMNVWETGSGSPVDLLALGRDLGINRHENFKGHVLVRFVSPKWKEALRLYLPALQIGNDDAMSEFVDLIERPASGVMAGDCKRNLIRLRRRWRTLDNGPVRDAVYDEMLDLITF